MVGSTLPIMALSEYIDGAETGGGNFQNDWGLIIDTLGACVTLSEQYYSLYFY